jgi:sigma-E factor negative regulatory protein RseA
MVMENISALMDGELEQHEAERHWKRLRDDPGLRDSWDAFHLIGDALRGDNPLSAGFTANLSQRLAEEPTVLAPRRLPEVPRRIATYALSAAASLAAVAVVGWVALSPTAPVGPVAVAPKTLPVVIDTAPVATVSTDGRMNEYLLAHQGFSPSTAIQGLAPYIRSVSTTRTFDGRQ